jgi:hypothetical protein
MQRLQQLDTEMIHCLDVIREMIPLATRNGANMAFATEFVIRELSHLNAEKRDLLSFMNRENQTPVHTPDRRRVSFDEEDDEIHGPMELSELDHDQGPMELSELDQEEEDEEPRSFIRRPIRFTEVLSDDDEDEGPMQLADLMDSAAQQSPISQVVTPDHVPYSEDGTNWAQDIDYWAQDWTDAQRENLEQPDPNVTVRAPAVQRRLFTCVRKMVFLHTSQQLREPCENACNVCFETTPLVDACETSCKHNFCKGCFVQWENACRGIVTCPTCRSERPVVTEYRQRS